MEFPIAKFRTLFPQFNSVDDATILAVAELAECYLCEGSCRDQTWMLAVAHMLALRQEPKPGQVTSAKIGGVSVSFTTAPSDSDYWWNLSPYGQQYLTLRCKAVPFYVTGRKRKRFPRDH